MKRLALLIGSPSDPKTLWAGKFLPGVQTDIENMDRFLTSSVGGSWKNSEIKTFFPNPSYASVSPYLRACENMDLAFIYFSGHGGTDFNGEAKVQFRYDEEPSVFNDLAQRARHQITIIDACRSYPETSEFSGAVLEGIDFPNENPLNARKLYDTYLNQIPNTRILLYATEKGKYSLDKGVDYGGLFSSSLLQVTKEIINNGNKSVFDIADIFNDAKIKTNIIEPTQLPKMYITDENSCKLPFAIKPKYILEQRENYQISKQSSSLIEDIAKAALIGAGIILTGAILGSLIDGNKK